MKISEEREMNFNEYQLKAMETAVYPETSQVIYPALGLAGEAGELANQVKKIIRDDGGYLTPERKEKIVDELGDVLWYCAALASDIGVYLDEVALKNLLKLATRRSEINIRGDNRD